MLLLQGVCSRSCRLTKYLLCVTFLVLFFRGLGSYIDILRKIRVLLTQDTGIVDVSIQNVLDSANFQFFWSFVTAWLSFRKDPNANRDEFLSEQRDLVSKCGLLPVQSPAIVKKAVNITETTIKRLADGKQGTNISYSCNRLGLYSVW